MILVDTSVWIDHFHGAEPRLVEALGQSRVGTHVGVTGELALGSLKSRALVLEHLRDQVGQTVVMEFESVEAAKAWYYSDAYQAAAKLRQAAANCNAVIIPGF